MKKYVAFMTMAVILCYAVVTEAVEITMYPQEYSLYDVKTIRDINVSFGKIPNDTYGVNVIVNWRDNSGKLHSDQFQFWHETLVMQEKKDALLIIDECSEKYVIGKRSGNRFVPVNGVQMNVSTKDMGYRLDFSAMMIFPNIAEFCHEEEQ